ncbi:3239_t:CDS:2 [Funneliformis mosseae]|uniref:3239_t:CDS:1 n=1 Tax=Funneliformis mosseae TaxID=27381 RepID=A0A9N9G4S2_FUNMO|nr:3239_t:CDS:2 [Funneliformis mosseae]
MPISKLEEKFELAKKTLIEFDREDVIKENTTERGTAEEKSIKKTTESREIVVFSDVSLERYHKFLEERKRFNVYVRLIKGKVIAYEMPSPPHSILTGEFCCIIKSWSNRLFILNDMDITVGNNSEYCVDIAVIPKRVPRHEPGHVPLPRMIVEIFSRREDGTAAMVVILYIRNNLIPNPALNRPNPRPNTPAMISVRNTIPNLVISFGTAPSIPNDIACTAAGMPGYQISIASNLLFHGSPGGVPQGTPNNFTIDLGEAVKLHNAMLKFDYDTTVETISTLAGVLTTFSLA